MKSEKSKNWPLSTFLIVLPALSKVKSETRNSKGEKSTGKSEKWSSTFDRF